MNEFKFWRFMLRPEEPQIMHVQKDEIPGTIAPAAARTTDVGATPPDIDNGHLICLLGIAPLDPAECVMFRIHQSALGEAGSGETAHIRRAPQRIMPVIPESRCRPPG